MEASLMDATEEKVISASCESCGARTTVDAGGSAAASFIYAIGRVEARFPRLSVEKEFAQATGRAATKNLRDREAMHSVLSLPENRYLARQLCWIMTIQSLESYVLRPRDPSDYDYLVEALRPAPSPLDLDLVVGLSGPIAPPDVCNGLMIPMVFFDQIYSFDRQSLIKAIPRPPKVPAAAFAPIAEELLERVLQMTDNAGATDGHRALNYLAVRYPAIYVKLSEAYARDASLAAVDARSASLSGARTLVDVVFSFVDRSTEVTDKFFVRVDVTEEFPFLVTKLSPYIDR